MYKRKINDTKNSNKKCRYAVKDILSFINCDEIDEKVLVLYGLRRTGKTTMMEQAMTSFTNANICAFYEATKKDTMDDIKDVIIKEQENGVHVIFIDEITKIKDFTSEASVLADIFAAEGMKIILAGTDSLRFSLAEDSELYDRTVRIRTTHISFAEHSEILGSKNIDDYIMYGGLMKKGISSHQIADYESAKRYLDSSVADNIAFSIKRDCCNSSLQNLSKDEIRVIIEKMVEIYSGTFNKTQMKEDLQKVSLNAPIDILLKSENREYFKPISMQKRNITQDFIKVINADKRITTPINDKMVNDFEKYLISMDLLSAVNKKEFRYVDEIGWMEQPIEKEVYIIQPAIKYHHLKKGLEFIEHEKYYQLLPHTLKMQMMQKLEENIKGDMTEQIVIFDTSKCLDISKYFVCKPEFYINDQRKGEYDMLIQDKINNKYWAFEIKHTNNPFIAYKNNEYIGQDKHLLNKKFEEIVTETYGDKQNVCVLYNGNPFTSPTGTVYLNLSDFLISLSKTKDVEKTMNILTKDIEKRPMDIIEYIGNCDKIKKDIYNLRSFTKDTNNAIKSANIKGNKNIVSKV